MRSAAMTELARLENKAEREFDSPNAAVRLGALLALSLVALFGLRYTPW